MTIRAVYEHGVLRPVSPLHLKEGETVDVTIESSRSPGKSMQEQGLLQQLQQASSIQEWLTVTEQLPSDDGGYDILAALSENRTRCGERVFTVERESS